MAVFDITTALDDLLRQERPLRELERAQDFGIRLDPGTGRERTLADLATPMATPGFEGATGMAAVPGAGRTLAELAAPRVSAPAVPGVPVTGGSSVGGSWDRAGGDLVPNQFDPTLSAAEAAAACGPAAAVAFARQMGRNPTMREAVDMAKQTGWTTAGGMNGIANQSRLLNQMGVAHRMTTNVDWDAVKADASSGNPVTISTPQHYFVVDGFNADTGQYHAGPSGTVFKGGGRWLTQQQIANLGRGVNGAIFVDAPTSPVPSVAARAAPSGSYQDMARGFATEAGIDPERFVRQIHQESGFNPSAGSPAGARGIAQIMPQFHPGVNPEDPVASLRYAAQLMARNQQQYGSLQNALIAYNAGPGGLQRYQRTGVLPGETQQYLRAILGGG